MPFKRSVRRLGSCWALALSTVAIACSSGAGKPETENGGAAASGGEPGGLGGSSLPGGGANPSAGSPTTGGSSPSQGDGGATYSAGQGGAPDGVGGKPSASAGGGSGGGSGGSANGMGGAGAGSTLRFSYLLGADVSFEESAPEATRANLLTILKAHGFNAIRLRTFVDPKAADGYDKTNGVNDLAHTIAFGKQIKSAGMGLLIDFHYSDNWADPGKQCVPVAWQGHTTIAQLATAVHDYTKDAITKLSAGGARPDMVQIGNETTPGLLIHRCDSGGQPTGTNPVNGSTSNWVNLGALLKAGVDGVKEVDSAILVSFHIDRGGDEGGSATTTGALNTSLNWLTNALKYTSVDAFGESTYQRYQGDLNSAANTQATWQKTLSGLASRFPDIKFYSAEYGPLQRELNDVVYNLPNQQGLGSFNWEPTTQGDWNTGHELLRRSGGTYTEQPDLPLYDQMKTAYSSRL